LPLLSRPELNKLLIGTHGGLDYAEIKTMGLAFDSILDFSVCCNPYPTPQKVRKSLDNLKIEEYPDSQSSELRIKLSKKLGLSIDHILVGNGTTELIRLTALAYFNTGDKVLIPSPTYGEYEIASRIAGAEVVEYHWKSLESETLNIKDLKQAIQHSQPKAVFLCNPNNPTGHYFSRDEIETLISSLDDTLLVLDEAYINFVNKQWSSIPLVKRGNIIILRSMTKDYGLAGLRLGYAVAAEDIINTLRRVCPPWNVNIAAQKAGIAVLGADNFIEQSQRRIWHARQFLVNELRSIGLNPLSTHTNFFLIKVDSGRSFRKALLRQGILVRDCASFGLPEYIRIAPRNMSDCRKLINVIKKLICAGALSESN